MHQPFTFVALQAYSLLAILASIPYLIWYRSTKPTVAMELQRPTSFTQLPATFYGKDHMFC